MTIRVAAFGQPFFFAKTAKAKKMSGDFLIVFAQDHSIGIIKL